MTVGLHPHEPDGQRFRWREQEEQSLEATSVTSPVSKPARALSAGQRRTLGLVARGFVSTSMLGSVGSLVRRGLVEDLGLYDYEQHCKRHGADRYKATAAGWLELKRPWAEAALTLTTAERSSPTGSERSAAGGGDRHE